MSYFSAATFKFLADIEKNNDRDWFKANQERYEHHVREPALDFITDFTHKLAQLSPHMVADPRKVGGSLFRIHRDTRFSKDKTPYKTNTGIHFRHEMAKDAHTPGFYLHIARQGSFAGVGIWRPPSDAVAQIRAHIDADPKAWQRAAHSKSFSSAFTLDDESLVRPPKGFEKDHPLIDDLKRKSFIGSTNLTQKQIKSETLLDDFGKLCKAGSPLMAFLCSALGLKY